MHIPRLPSCQNILRNPSFLVKVGERGCFTSGLNASAFKWPLGTRAVCSLDVKSGLDDALSFPFFYEQRSQPTWSNIQGRRTSWRSKDLSWTVPSFQPEYKSNNTTYSCNSAIPHPPSCGMLFTRHLTSHSTGNVMRRLTRNPK